jgi:hypothetical protein
MASYFELPPQQSTGAANIDAVPDEQKKRLGRTSLLSPAVALLLDNWGGDHSDSDSEEGSLSGKEDTSLDEPDKKRNPAKSRSDSRPEHPKPATSSLSPKTAERAPAKGSHPVSSPVRASASGSTKKTGQPHIARFHSLRSMLFFSSMEEKVKKMSHEDREKEAQAANKWKSQHDQRQMPGRPKSPENNSESKEQGMGSRIKTRIKRMTSKEVPTMTTLSEDGGAHDFIDHGSTASSDVEKEPYQWKPRESDEESIHHSDVEDLVRWISRRDPPSDGEAKTASNTPQVTLTKGDSDRESIGNSDVDDLVQWVSRKSSRPETEPDGPQSLTDASTESDSDRANEQGSSDEEDTDDLVRWISRRDGSTAGPVRRKQQDNTSSGGQPISHMEDDSEISQTGHCVKRNRTMSGDTADTSPTLSVPDEPERGRPLSRDGPARPKPKGHVTNDDVDDLVSWVSRKKSKDHNPPVDEEQVAKLQREEDAKKKQLGMTVDQGSLSHSDVQNLIEDVKASDLPVQGIAPTVKASSVATEKPIPARPNEAESGDLRQHRTAEHEVSKAMASDYLTASRSASTDVEVGIGKQKAQRDSLGEEDVDELVKWVSRKS